jgi:XapX domain-containing protein
MKPYFLSLGAGVLVGVVYRLLSVRSPAPPAIALLGFLGMLAGEQVVPVVKWIAASQPITQAWFHKECVPHMFDTLPTGGSARKET